MGRYIELDGDRGPLKGAYSLRASGRVGVK
jgi:hypothetical protein